MFGKNSFWNKEDSLAEKLMYNEEYIKDEKERKEKEDNKRLEKERLEKERLEKESIKKETKPKDYIRIAGKKNERITNFFTIKI